MTALHLARTDTSQNMARYYPAGRAVRPIRGLAPLAGVGRMGHSGTVRIDPTPTRGRPKPLEPS